MNFIDLKTQYARIEDDVQSRLRAVFEHGKYIMGPEIDELETALAGYVGSRHCIAVSSGTDALLIAMMALGIGRDDEVITTPFTFIATGEMIALLGARPVYVDIDPRTYNIDPQCIEEAITSRTRAIVPVSLYGQCAEMDAINAIGAKHKLPVIEDGAQSFGATYKGRRSCGLSAIGCTSFFPSKPLGGYGDGGACFTDEDDLAKLMREIRVHGQDRRYHHPVLGINGRLDTLQAAILLAKMRIFPDEVASRGRIGRAYTERLADARCVTPHIEPYNTSVFAQYTIRVEEREQVASRLKALGIPTAVHYPVPLNHQPVFLGQTPEQRALPNAEEAARQVISLPMHPYMSEGDQQRIVAAVTDATRVS